MERRELWFVSIFILMLLHHVYFFLSKTNNHVCGLERFSPDEFARDIRMGRLVLKAISQMERLKLSLGVRPLFELGRAVATASIIRPPPRISEMRLCLQLGGHNVYTNCWRLSIVSVSITSVYLSQPQEPQDILQDDQQLVSQLAQQETYYSRLLTFRGLVEYHQLSLPSQQTNFCRSSPVVMRWYVRHEHMCT